MSSVLIVAPIVVASWPVISAAVTAAIGTLGFTLVRSELNASVQQTTQGKSSNREVIEVEESEILAGATGVSQQLVVERDGVRATFSRDARGALKLCVDGHHLSKSQLRAIGEELIGRVTQQYAYHHIMSELKERNMTVVDEQMTTEQSVKIRVRNF
ncbi:MAG TPA: DUF1257 domain-containing protein [Pirellulales bacterium]|jgi:hypothetical protein|nr:DUF1257 domain-containing protein [Pirellulales bacterium]